MVKSVGFGWTWQWCIPKTFPRGWGRRTALSSRSAWAKWRVASQPVRTTKQDGKTNKKQSKQKQTTVPFNPQLHQLPALNQWVASWIFTSLPIKWAKHLTQSRRGNQEMYMNKQTLLKCSLHCGQYMESNMSHINCDRNTSSILNTKLRLDAQWHSKLGNQVGIKNEKFTFLSKDSTEFY